MKSFGAMIKNELKRNGMKQRDLAKLMNTSEACISRWIHGNRFPNGSSIMKIMYLLNCHIEIVPNDDPLDPHFERL